MIRKILIFSMTLMLFAISAQAEVSLENKKPVSLEFESTPLLSVLNMLAQQNGFNLVAAGAVSGVVSVRLQDVDIETALDAILTANGYTWFLKDNVIVVKSIKDVEASEFESKTITLKYLDPVTAKKALEPRLSENGQVVILDRTGEGNNRNSRYVPNRIIITDLPAIVGELASIIQKIDIRERTVLIEARIIETKLSNQSKLGVNWPSSFQAKLSGADDGTSTTTSSSSIATTISSDAIRNIGAYDLGAGRWTWGKLSVGELRVVLDFLEQDGNSRLVSDPRITTIENHQAEFKFQTIIPIQTINRFTEGAATSDIVSFEDEEVGISLKVTPRINEGGTITLDVYPTVEDIIGFNGPPDNQKPITSSRSIITRITVESGETVALGGLIKDDEIETIKRIPFLGSIPLLGSWLFTHRSKETSRTDLTILITPKILD